MGRTFVRVSYESSASGIVFGLINHVCRSGRLLAIHLWSSATGGKSQDANDMKDHIDARGHWIRIFAIPT